MGLSSKNIDKILIVSVTPYFLDRRNLWFEENVEKILEAKKTLSFFEDNIIFVEKQKEFNFSQFLRKLDEMGYEKVQNVSEPGEFSRQGGVIDVFPINANFALRIDFYGNLIENMEELPVEMGDEKEVKERIKKKLKRQKLFSDLKGIKTGDYLVHLDHGVGIYGGRTSLGVPAPSDYYVLEYAQSDKLYVPLGLERK